MINTAGNLKHQPFDPSPCESSYYCPVCTMSKFSFRQRAGVVDWKSITSVKTEDIVSKADTKQLQTVLDSATFCEFRPDDVRNNSIESVAKLVNILQYISEYLLHCQEAQFKVIRDMQLKTDNNLDSISKLKKENLALKEDRKIYQRQLAMLRKSLGPDYFLNNHSASLKELRPPVVTQLLNKGEPKEPERRLDTEVIESILKHEGETRQFMTTMLNDQRTVFLEQIRSISDSLRAAQGQQSGKENETQSERNSAWADKLQHQMENSLKSAVDTMKNTVAQAVAAMAEEQKRTVSAVATLRASPAPTVVPASAQQASSSAAHKVDVQMALQTAALEQFEQELARRQEALDRKERELSMKEDMVRGTQELTLAARRASDTERLDLLTANEVIAMNAFSVAARVIFNTVKHALIRKKRTAWHHWYVLVLNRREIENSAEQAKLLVYAKDQRSLRESELQTLLDLEREKSAAALAKQNVLLRDLSAAENRLLEVTSERGLHSSSRDADLEQLLQKEREKVIVATAKYNTLKSKADKEIAALQEKLQSAEDTALFERMEGAARPGALMSRDHALSPAGLNDVSVGTSASFTTFPASPDSSTPRYQHAPPVPHHLHLRQSLQQQYISSGASEQDLFSKVQRKLASRKSPEEIEAEAMAQLAEEITARLNQQQQ